jgi:predicted HAD superfamily phosphohydrolase YqeG
MVSGRTVGNKIHILPYSCYVTEDKKCGARTASRQERIVGEPMQRVATRATLLAVTRWAPLRDREYAGALVDLDGTVYLGDQLLPGADTAVASLRDRGVSVLFLTNKAIERRATYCEKLTRLGVPAGEEDVITSGAMTAEFLAAHHASAPVFVVGEQPL